MGGSDGGTEGSVLWRRNLAEERTEKGESEEVKETPYQQAPWRRFQGPKGVFSFQVQRDSISGALVSSSQPRRAQDGETEWPGTWDLSSMGGKQLSPPAPPGLCAGTTKRSLQDQVLAWM